MSFRTLVYLALVPSIILHEVSHGWVALAFGDDTAKRAGRLTLNPIPHIDALGTIILPGLLVLSGSAPFGWAKPVPVTPSRLRNPRQQSVLVSLVGPATNIALAVIAAAAFDALRPGDPTSDVTRFALAFGYANVLLAAFNLLPIPPLDGSAIIERFLPARLWPRWLRFRQYSMGVLLIVVFLLPGVLSNVFDRALRLWEHLL